MYFDEHAVSRESLRALESVQRTVVYLNCENTTGPGQARVFLESPSEEWWVRAKRQRADFGFGALSYLLDVAREEIDRNVKRAWLLSGIVLRLARTMPAPADSMFRCLLLGRAWKDHGSSLRAMGKYNAACAASLRAIRILSRHASLRVEQAAAQVLRALVEHRLERTREAVTILRECNAVFQRFGENHRSLQVAVIEAVITYEAGDVAAARSAFLLARAAAERLGNQRELARILHNLGECEQRLGNFDQALIYLRAALAAFEREGMTAERQRVFWIMARTLRDCGQLEAAITRLIHVRHELLERGLALQAALAGLDLLELLAATDHREDVVDIAADLVRAFNAARMPRRARMALAYLQEHAQMDSVASFQDDVRRVRGYLNTLISSPEEEFVPPAPH